MRSNLKWQPVSPPALAGAAWRYTVERPTDDWTKAHFNHFEGLLQDTFDNRLVQVTMSLLKNKDFHNVGVFSDEGGWIQYVHRDSARKLSDESLANWKTSSLKYL